jgi:cysteine-rich repeat protein
VVAPETCDPPYSTIQPLGRTCRIDCTYCGDGVVQSEDAESCDDGNAVSGCRPDLPQQPLDACLNSCQEPICQDPSKIKLFPFGKLDMVVVHGRLVAAVPMAFEENDFTIRLERQACSADGSACEIDSECQGPNATCSPNNDGSVVYFASLPVGAIPHPLPGTWKYKNPLAKQAGGVFSMKIKAEPPECANGDTPGASCQIGVPCAGSGVCVVAYKVTMKAFGDVLDPVSDMEAQVFAGNRRWAVRGLWTSQSASIWKFNKFSKLLEPWP